MAPRKDYNLQEFQPRCGGALWYGCVSYVPESLPCQLRVSFN